MNQTLRHCDSNQITREYFDSLLIEMRHIGANIPDTSISLYGERFSSPVMTAALSHLSKYHPGAMAELARGAKAANALMWAGMGDDQELESITATGAKTIKIIKPYTDNSLIFSKIEHAKACGCIAVGMDIDHSYNAHGEYDSVSGRPLSGKTLDELKQFVLAAKLPFILKGVLSVRDAHLCMEAGIQGIVVSHHHGIMDYAIPPLMVLPEIAKVVGGTIPIFLDCCVEDGYDVFKALALGASAVSVGRRLLKPLSDGGSKSVAASIREITSQLAGVMARTCSPNIATIDPRVIWKTR